MDRKYRPGEVAKEFDHKTAVCDVELKGSDGRFVARIFTFGGPDHDGDIQVPGSIVNEGAVVPVSSWGHGSWKSAPPVGQAAVRLDGTGALAEGRFYLSTQAGREHFEIVRSAGKSQSWSYGFDITDHDYDGGHRVIRAQVVHEVSPVLRAAGIGTETVSIDTGPETRAADLSDLAAIKAQVDAQRLHDEYVTIRARNERARFEQMRSDR